MRRRRGRSPICDVDAAMAAARKSPTKDDHDTIAAQIAQGNLTRERSCDGKTRFKSYNFAETVGRTKPELEGKEMRVYACPFCRGFHLTSVVKVAS